MDFEQEGSEIFEQAGQDVIELGNRLADLNPDADVWDIGSGLLAGAVQFWLYSRQPCGDPGCEECLPISTSEGRTAELRRLIEQFAEESQYFHTPTDANAGRA